MAVDIGKLNRLASSFRERMERTDFSDTQSLNSFPTEACEVTCKLLGLHLYDNGFRGHVIYCGKRPNGDKGYHHWIQFGDIVVDITFDQFGADVLPKVIAEENSPSHLNLNGYAHQHFDADYYDKLMNHDSQEYTREMYSRVK